MATNTAPDLSKARLSATGGSIPPTYWTTLTNVDPNWTWIVVPSDGTLWVFYEWRGQPAQQIVVWHHGGRTTPVNGGENMIQVARGDMIMYELADPATDQIKLGYQMLP